MQSSWVTVLIKISVWTTEKLYSSKHRRELGEVLNCVSIIGLRVNICFFRVPELLSGLNKFLNEILKKKCFKLICMIRTLTSKGVIIWKDITSFWMSTFRYVCGKDKTPLKALLHCQVVSESSQEKHLYRQAICFKNYGLHKGQSMYQLLIY